MIVQYRREPEWALGHSTHCPAALWRMLKLGWWTEDKLAHVRYNAPNACLPCQISRDTIDNIFYCCQHPEAVALRSEFLTPDVVQAALEAPEQSLLFCCGEFEHPGEQHDDVPLPLEVPIVQFKRHDGQPERVHDFWGLPGTDGSCTRLDIAELSRAPFSVG
ncbi:unnamed protein product [Prorocentrum cordatum]|uniref:Reverse transcriptase zinc-binding domain-containing protein n=1 Tax=Prorocentrum cordatum TaxID=2364126 RepID=A0ABN9Y9E4_9DINO|nr:unnamed protein product [Polarella glacialis]